MRGNTLKHIGLGVIFVLSHILLFQHLKIFGAIADPVLIFVVWLATQRDRTSTLIIAAGLGFFQDALFDVWGLYMFSKTLLAFLIYNTINKYTHKKLIIWQIFVIMLIIAVIHNLLFISLGSVIESYSIGISIVSFLVGNSIYTSIIAALLYIFKEN